MQLCIRTANSVASYANAAFRDTQRLRTNTQVILGERYIPNTTIHDKLPQSTPAALARGRGSIHEARDESTLRAALGLDGEAHARVLASHDGRWQ